MIAKIRRKIRRQFEDKSFEEVLRGALLVFSSRIGETVFTMATSILIARIYGAEVVGVLAAVRSAMEILIIFGLMGTDVGLLRLIPSHRETNMSSARGLYVRVLKMVLLSSLVVSLLLLFGSGWLAEVQGKGQIAPFYFLAAIFIIPKTLFKLNIEALRGLKKFKLVAIQNMSLAVTNLTVLVVLTVLFTNKFIPVYGYLITMCIVGSLATFLVFRSFAHQISKDAADGIKTKVMKAKEVLQISAPMFATKSAFLILGHADIQMILLMREDTAEVGIYQVAWKLIMFNKFFKNSITSTAAPKLSELHAKGATAELKHVAKKTTMLLGYTVLPFLIAMVIFGKPLLGGLYGREFIAGYNAFIFLGVAQMITAVLGHVGMFMNMTGKQNLYMWIVIMAAVMNIVLNALWIPTYGITGAAAANVVSVLFTHLVATAYIKRNFGFTIAYPPLIGLFRRGKGGAEARESEDKLEDKDDSNNGN